MGLDFSVGCPVLFDEWFLNWMNDVPDIHAILESISLLWAIWCGRNNVVFQKAKVEVLQDLKNAKYWYLMLCKMQQVELKNQATSGEQHSSGNNGIGIRKVVLKDDKDDPLTDNVLQVLVDGAWRKETWDGAVAWADASKKENGGSCKVVASSALMTKAVAVLKALDWAKNRGSRKMEICTDCLLLVRGLSSLDSVPVLVKPILLDILKTVESFSFVCVTKVARQLVGVAHTLAKRCMV